MRRPSRSGAEYHDRAISGATKHRPRLDRLLRDGEQGGFDAILLESLDRLSRDLEHVADFFKQLHFWGVRMLTLNEEKSGHCTSGCAARWARSTSPTSAGHATRQSRLGARWQGERRAVLSATTALTASTSSTSRRRRSSAASSASTPPAAARARSSSS